MNAHSWASSQASISDALALRADGDEDYVAAASYIWSAQQNLFSHMMLGTTVHTKAFQRNQWSIPFTDKAVMIPDRVSKNWVHMPVECFGGTGTRPGDGH